MVTAAFLYLGLAPLIVMAHEDPGLQSIFGISRKQPFFHSEAGMTTDWSSYKNHFLLYVV